MNKPKQWHVANWSPLGWIETTLKVVAFIFAGLFIIPALQAGTFIFPSGRLILIIQIILSLGLVAAIFDRFKEKEIIAAGFVLVNNIAHWGIVYSLGTGSVNQELLLMFFVFMLAGDLIKLFFIKTTDFSARGFPKSVLYGLTMIYVVGYSIQILILFLT